MGNNRKKKSNKKPTTASAPTVKEPEIQKVEEQPKPAAQPEPEVSSHIAKKKNEIRRRIVNRKKIKWAKSKVTWKNWI